MDHRPQDDAGTPAVAGLLDEGVSKQCACHAEDRDADRTAAQLDQREDPDDPHDDIQVIDTVLAVNQVL